MATDKEILEASARNQNHILDLEDQIDTMQTEIDRLKATIELRDESIRDFKLTRIHLFHVADEAISHIKEMFVRDHLNMKLAKHR